MSSIWVATAEEMERLGACLAQTCVAPATVYLGGELGAGKTTLVRGFLRELGIQGPFRSPTYTLVEPYESADTTCLHLDLYRLAAAEELEYLGLRELNTHASIWLIEWPQVGEGALPPPDLDIQIAHLPRSRRVALRPRSERGKSWARTLNSRYL